MPWIMRKQRNFRYDFSNFGASRRTVASEMTSSPDVFESGGDGSARCEVRVFGHALLEKLIAPYPACTAHAWVVEVPEAWFTWSRAQRDAHLDETVSATLATAAVLDGRSFAPLPVLGIPGWWPANADPAFYDDTTVFRPGRRAR